MASKGSELPHDVWSGEHRPPFEPIFAPRTVAVIGASEEAGSAGRTLLRNLLNNPLGETVYPLNREQSSVPGVEARVRVAIVVSAGFREVGDERAELE